MIKVLGRMRNTPKLSLKKASQPTEEDVTALDKAIDPRTVVRWAGTNLKRINGRYVVKKHDNLLRIVNVTTPEGVREFGVHGFRRVSLLGEYEAFIKKYLITGDSTGLTKFEGLTIKDESGETIPSLPISRF
jgi:hypothetical protein